jgi:WhiB family redox-sensing transcriptional regulator
MEPLSFLPLFEHAACRAGDVDPAIFFPVRGAPVEPAKAICRTCPHTAECLQLGITEPVGIWGGTTERERRILRRHGSLGVTLELETSVNGNGTSPEPAARSCPECGGPVPKGRRVTCSTTCAAKHDRHAKGPRRTPLARASLPVGMPPSSTPASSGLAAAAAALVGSLGDLAGLQRVTVELGAHVVTVSRAELAQR